MSEEQPTHSVGGRTRLQHTETKLSFAERQHRRLEAAQRRYVDRRVVPYSTRPAQPTDHLGGDGGG